MYLLLPISDLRSGNRRIACCRFCLLSRAYAHRTNPVSIFRPRKAHTQRQPFTFALLNFIIHPIQDAEGQTNSSFLFSLIFDFFLRLLAAEKERQTAFLCVKFLFSSPINGHKITEQHHDQNAELINYLKK